MMLMFEAHHLNQVHLVTDQSAFSCYWSVLCHVCILIGIYRISAGLVPAVRDCTSQPQ